MGTLLICLLWLCLLPHLCCSARQFGSRLQGAYDLAIRLEPTFEVIAARAGRRTSASKTYALWQAPPSPKALLVIAHGILQGPEVWWDASPACPFCKAYPEERAIVLSALARDHAVVTIKSVSYAANACSWPDGYGRTIQDDLDIVQEFVGSWSLRQGLSEQLPVAALGVSAGGYLVSAMALQMKLYAIVLQISSGGAHSFEAARDPFPPSLFISMPRDVESEEEIQNTILMLSRKGLRSESIGCQPSPVFESYLAERIPGLGLRASAAVYKALVEYGHLDDEGYLNKPAEVVDWRVYTDWDWLSFVESLHVLPDGSNWINPVAEELALSYAFHAVTSSKATKMLDWLDEYKKEQCL